MPICKTCKNHPSASMMTTAECGHEVARAGMKLCPACARTKNACECCGKPLKPGGPPDPGDIPPHTD